MLLLRARSPRGLVGLHARVYLVSDRVGRTVLPSPVTQAGCWTLSCHCSSFPTRLREECEIGSIKASSLW